ncbi:MAG: hypothetical protein BroJett018_30810 [Chloroflexota bacterium]|nr:hypothetical protein [Chloroflexota bacterium]NOG65561.1 hypothetical protein [Chloroflexota bacterium]GIK65287.1 MAG: hypothetical protein BroJett018_30810 [Chloroflexota bacterium]
MDKDRDKRLPTLSFEQVAQLAREILLQQGSHLPTLIVEGHNQMVVSHLTPLEDTHEGRAQQMFSAGYVLAEANVIGVLKQVFFVCEAWMSFATEGKMPTLPPSEDPSRKEVLMISNLKVQEQTGKVAILEMLRNEAGDVTEIREFQEHLMATHADSPLLTAFIHGFDAGMNTPVNGGFDAKL